MLERKNKNTGGFQNFGHYYILFSSKVKISYSEYLISSKSYLRYKVLVYRYKMTLIVTTVMALTLTTT